MGVVPAFAPPQPSLAASLLPVCAFVAAGFERSVANMRFIPMGAPLAAAEPEAPARNRFVTIA